MRPFLRFLVLAAIPLLTAAPARAQSADDAFKLLYFTDAPAASVDWIRPFFKIRNDGPDTLVTGTAAIDLTGNDLAQEIIGNEGANMLFGLGGNDVLRGGAGNDRLYGGFGTVLGSLYAGRLTWLLLVFWFVATAALTFVVPRVRGLHPVE